MNDFSLTTPVAFFIFNRVDTAERVFSLIREARPARLLVIADGPRADHPDDIERCGAARSIIERVDWNCEVTTNFASANLGCKRRMASGLDWVFSLTDEAIILEHDTLPHPSFFRFCQELLARYRDDKRVMSISGCNFQFGQERTAYSYYFSRCVHCWGWATWRRAWQYYDVNMTLWPEIAQDGWLTSLLGSGLAHQYWSKVFDVTHRGYVDTWDYQWVFNCWSQNGMTILPHVNLVANIGFGDGATHTVSDSSYVANMPTMPIAFPLRHPPFMLHSAAADDFTQNLYIHGDM